MAEDIIDTLREIVGERDVLTGEAAAGRSSEWETHQPCHAKAVVRPAATEQVAAIMRACHERAQTVVPYGGLTNLVQGCATTPDDIAISFEKMNQIEEVDTTAHTMTVQAGVTMLEAQERAEQSDLFFPVDIGARGTCVLGGNVASNAGGSKVIRYGMIRDSVLGLEAVLADGTVVSSMNRFIKNNSGFDLKHLFIGTEGVLGLITRIVFRLHAKPQSHNVALLACADYGQVVTVLNKARELLGSALCGFEVMWNDFFDIVTKPVGKHRSPFDQRYPIYAIVEAMGMNASVDSESFEAVLTEIFESGLVTDAVVAKSDKELDAIWAIRGEVEWLVKDCFNFDVSLSVADVGAYVDKVKTGIHGDFPNAIVAAFGHLGDNNIHISVECNSDEKPEIAAVEKHVYEALVPYGGAISAEHGIGLEKKPYLALTRSAEEIELMKTLKRSMDPKNILNPGKVISVE